MDLKPSENGIGNSENIKIGINAKLCHNENEFHKQNHLEIRNSFEIHGFKQNLHAIQPRRVEDTDSCPPPHVLLQPHHHPRHGLLLSVDSQPRCLHFRNRSPSLKVLLQINLPSRQIPSSDKKEMNS